MTPNGFRGRLNRLTALDAGEDPMGGASFAIDPPQVGQICGGFLSERHY